MPPQTTQRAPREEKFNIEPFIDAFLAVGAIAATGGLASIGIPGLIGGSAAAAGTGAGISAATRLAIGSSAAQAAAGIYGAHANAKATTQAATTTTTCTVAGSRSRMSCARSVPSSRDHSSAGSTRIFKPTASRSPDTDTPSSPGYCSHTRWRS